tara:strand:- start:539 stop:745 length:207 start_codon:yes stop_codon:yes gene_type:complete
MFKMKSQKRSNSMVEEREEKRLETEDVGGNEIGWNRLKQILILICWGLCISTDIAFTDVKFVEMAIIN